MKVIDSMWFNTLQGSFGFVLGENEMGECKLYAGVAARGLDQSADEQAILSWGNKVNIGMMEGPIAKTKEIPQKTAPSAAELDGEPLTIDLDLLKESLKYLKWSDDTAKTWIVSEYKVSPTGTLEAVIKRLTQEQAEEFVKEIQGKVDNKQVELF
ncbi:hypothetical protein ES703_69254 [subsurface metagenome]